MSEPALKPPRRNGRPKKAAAEARELFMGFRVNAAEQAAIHARAAAARLDTSVLMREAAKGAPIRVRPSRYAPEVGIHLRRIGNNLNQLTKLAHTGQVTPAVSRATEDALREVAAFVRALYHGDDPKG